MMLLIILKTELKSYRASFMKKQSHLEYFYFETNGNTILFVLCFAITKEHFEETVEALERYHP